MPFAVRWPARVKPGVSDALVSQVDLLASLASLVGEAVPKEPTNIELANDPQPQLYDLDTDLGETKNLAAQHPDRVKAMAERLATIRR